MFNLQFKIWHKLALVFTLISIVSISIGIGLSYRHFKHSFLEYRQNIEHRKLNRIAEQVIVYYRQNKSWDALRGNNPLWFRLLRPMPGRHLYGQHSSAPKRPFREPPRKRALLDKHQRYLVGNQLKLKESFLFPIQLDGNLIAYIQSQQPAQLIDRLDSIFAERLNKAFILNFIMASMIALMMALLVSYYMNRRIKPISDIARELALGHYQQRITSQSSDELGLLARDINHLALTLEKNKQAQQQWIAGISHELRTPVSILKGEIEAAKDGIRSLDAPLIESLSQETQRISLLIEDLYQLSIADLGALKYQKQAVMIEPLIREITEIYQHKAEKQQLRLELQTQIDDNLSWIADRQRLFQLLSNLLENSCRYTDAPGQIRFKVSASLEQITIQIEDSKPAIEEQHLQQIFEPLYRIEKSRSRSYGGAGLGLAIAKQIVDAHQGRMIAGKSILGGLSIQCSFTTGLSILK